MGSVLLAMPKPDDSRKIERILRTNGITLDTDICQTGAEVLRMAGDRDYGVVLCTSRLRDMNYKELSELLPTHFGMIVLTSDASLETFSDRTIKLMLPLKTTELMATISLLTKDYDRRSGKGRKAPPKGRNTQERQRIDQAKAILMDRNGMSEPEAFRYLQKTSMDTGRTLVETAEMILLMQE